MFRFRVFNGSPRNKCLLLKHPTNVLTAVNNAKNFHAIFDWTVNYYVAGPRNDETPMIPSETWTGYSEVGIIRKQIKSLCNLLNEEKSIITVKLGDIVMNPL